MLYEKMIFYNRKAKLLYAAIIEKLRQDGARADVLAGMAKQLQRCNDIAIDCAAKLAPYQSPKLQSMEVNKKITQRFVIEAPQQMMSSHAWLENSKKLIDITPKMENNERATNLAGGE